MSALVSQLSGTRPRSFGLKLSLSATSMRAVCCQASAGAPPATAVS